MARTRHEWWNDLAGLSTTVAGLKVPADETYLDTATNQSINSEAFNLSSCSRHNEAIARWADALAIQGKPLPQIEKLLTDLTSRNTYGTFSELAAYGLLLDTDIPFDIQIPMTGKDILNPNGSDLDGALQIGNTVYFDVKAFGFHEHLAEQIETKLSQVFPSHFVAISESSDVGVADMSDLLRQGLSGLITDLKANSKASRGMLDIRLEPPRAVHFVTNSSNPYELAKNNADYVFRFAKQFVRRKPFILVFVIHPWLGGLRLSQNFASDTETFMRSFARRTFMQFRSDRTKVFDVTRRTASRLLSGIMFIDAWQQSPARPPVHALYLNPHAKHPISRLTRDHLVTNIPNINFDDFEHDTY